MLNCFTLLRRGALSACLLALLAPLGCTESIPVANTLATIDNVGDAVATSDAHIEVSYELSDEEGDDQEILVQVCEGDESSATACGVAFEAPGSDNSAFVPTELGGRAIAHRFIWEAECGRVSEEELLATALDQQYVMRFKVRDSEESDWVYSSAFTPQDLGLDMLPDCMR